MQRPIFVDKNQLLLRYNLVSGDKVKLAGLFRADGKLAALYDRVRVFPFYRSG